MQAAQRSRDNAALEFAVRLANNHQLPLAVVLCVVPDYPDNARRHMRFLLEGLADVASALERRGVAFEALLADPTKAIPVLARRAAAVVTERGYLPIQRRWRREVADAVTVPMVQIETEAVVPVDLVTDKEETAARTIRPRIHEHLADFTVELTTTPVAKPSTRGSADAISLSRTGPGFRRINVATPGDALRDITQHDTTARLDATPGPVEGRPGGQNAAYAALGRFMDDVLPEYADKRNRYDLDFSSSELSPYLHFGQISPTEIVRRVQQADAPAEHVDAYTDEIVVRRELAINHVLHNPKHDRFSGLPSWSRETLRAHADDKRPSIYTASQLEAGETDDGIWNTIMDEIRDRGWVHNQLRMYWGKKILYWTNTPEHAFRTLLDMNNRLFLDGRDANSYANVGWCFGLHDQGFKERPVIGKVRPFTDAALRRKGDLSAWLADHT